VRAQRGRDADDQRVALAEAVEVGRGLDFVAAERLPDALFADMADVGLPVVQRARFLGVDVESEDGKALLFEEQHERQADIAEADDADAQSTRLDGLDELLQLRGLGQGHTR